MIKVSQRTKEDCERACIASIFEIAYEDTKGITGYAEDAFKWTKKHYPALGLRIRNLTGTFGEKENLSSYRDWPRSAHHEGYWIASIWSPRIEDTMMKGCGCKDRHPPHGDPGCKWCHGIPDERELGIFWGLHAVCMRGREIVWDPHPDADPNMEIYFSDEMSWFVKDPSKLSFRD